MSGDQNFQHCDSKERLQHWSIAAARPDQAHAVMLHPDYGLGSEGPGLEEHGQVCDQIGDPAVGFC